MASGKTLELLNMSRYRGARQRMQVELDPKDRDRSLRGKARVRARKAAQREARRG